MPNAAFTHPNGSLTFSRGPRRPENSRGPVQPTRKTAAGVRKGFASVIGRDLIKLPLRLDEAEKDQLIGFWDTVVDGMAEVFTYTDSAGIDYTVTFEDPTLPDLIEIAYGSYEVTVTLRVQ